ncbi:MAG: hypothetical protein IPP44_29835 [Ideonella sp.]|nr:hypothetical protein [Ideonella sp.]
MVWVSGWGGNAMFRFDPARALPRIPFVREAANVRQILGRPARCSRRERQ